MKYTTRTCLAMLLAMPLPVAADSVAFEAEPDAKTVKLTLDAGLDATVHWADGTAEKVHFDGNLQELRLVSPSFSIETSGHISYVVCPDNPLTSINLNGAPYVKGVYAQNCRLKSFTPGLATNLEVLHLSGNTGIKEAMDDMQLSALTFLGVADCGLTQLPDGKAMPCLKGLWAWDNGLTAADIAGATDCEHVYLQNNKLKTLTAPHALKTLRASGNRLQTLNLQDCDSLETLDVSDNGLRTLTTSTACASSLRHLYVDNNSLVYSDMPTLTDDKGDFYVQSLALAGQKAILIPSVLAENAMVSIAIHISNNQWGKELAPEVVWTDKEGNRLTEGTDYVEVGDYRYAFLTAQEAVKANITCAEYPGMALTTTEMRVPVPATAIGSVDADEECPTVMATGNRLTVTTSKPMEVTICSVNGNTLHSGLLDGQWSRQLPAGIYVVNNRKIIIGSRLTD